MSTINLIDNVALDDTATADATSTVGEPSLGVAGDSIFVTGNWYASRSTDNGGQWDHVDPFTTLPSAAGGFCCDQVTLHDARRKLKTRLEARGFAPREMLALFSRPKDP